MQSCNLLLYILLDIRSYFFGSFQALKDFQRGWLGGGGGGDVDSRGEIADCVYLIKLISQSEASGLFFVVGKIDFRSYIPILPKD